MEIVVEGQNQPKNFSPKIMKFQEILEEGNEDRISALPDCLIVEILSRLPCTKEAIKTGTLSKRWEHLWTLLPTLVFTNFNDNPPWSDFVSLIDKTLTQCRQLKLKKFRVDSSYYTGFDAQVHNWIRYALRCNVEELDLSLWNVGCPPEFPVDQFLFNSSCFSDLRLSGCILNPTGAITWKNLRSLCIFNGKLDEDLIEKILSGSPLLEILELHDCYGYRMINITSKSVKKLVLYGYVDPEDKDDLLADTIEINAPNILSLTIQGGLLLWKLLLLNVCSVVKAKLDYRKMGHCETTIKGEEEEMLAGFILNLRHAKVLKIGIFCYKALFRLEEKGFVFPSNMKFLDDWSESDLDESEDW